MTIRAKLVISTYRNMKMVPVAIHGCTFYRIWDNEEVKKIGSSIVQPKSMGHLVHAE